MYTEQNYETREFELFKKGHTDNSDCYGVDYGNFVSDSSQAIDNGFDFESSEL